MNMLFLQEALNPKVGIICAIIISFCLHKLLKRNKNQKSYEFDDSEESEDDGVFVDEKDTYKLVFLIRTDLKMKPGKTAAQCAHATVAAYKSALKHPTILQAWEANGQKKVTLKVDSETTLLELDKHAKSVGLLSNYIMDAGRTQVAKGSKTVCAIGPGPTQLIDSVTGHLKLY